MALNFSPEYTPVKIAISVIHICAVDKNFSGFSANAKAAFALISPLLAMLSSLAFRALTKAISLITKSPFNNISTSKIKISAIVFTSNP